LFVRAPDEIWNFYEYWTHEIWKYENIREVISHPIPNPYMMHVIQLDENQFGEISYEYSHTLYVPISCDYCDLFDHDVDTCLLLGRITY